MAMRDIYRPDQRLTTKLLLLSGAIGPLLFADACQACGLCVVAFPEQTITLVQIGGTEFIRAI